MQKKQAGGGGSAKTVKVGKVGKIGGQVKKKADTLDATKKTMAKDNTSDNPSKVTGGRKETGNGEEGGKEEGDNGEEGE